MWLLPHTFFLWDKVGDIIAITNIKKTKQKQKDQKTNKQKQNKTKQKKKNNGPISYTKFGIRLSRR